MNICTYRYIYANVYTSIYVTPTVEHLCRRGFDKTFNKHCMALTERYTASAWLRWRAYTLSRAFTSTSCDKSMCTNAGRPRP